MNEQISHPGDNDLPPELHALAASLDELAALDRRAPGAAFEHRLAAATAPGAPLSEERLTALAAAERLAASPSLEDRIFVATRSLLQRPGAASITPDASTAHQPPASLKIHTRNLTWVLRVAAAFTLVATASLTYISTRPGPSPIHMTDAPDATPLLTAAQLEDDFADLATILNVALGSADSETASNGVAESLDTTGFDLPSFDFLNAEMEGSL